MGDGVNHGIGPHDRLMLDLFGELVWEAWGERGYIVGSSQRGVPWRDVDIRVMVSREEFQRWFGTTWQDGRRHQNPLWRAHMLAWSKLGQQLTGLPIDFQVERISEANAKHRDEPRNPIGTWRGLIPESKAIAEVLAGVGSLLGSPEPENHALTSTGESE